MMSLTLKSVAPQCNCISAGQVFWRRGPGRRAWRFYLYTERKIKKHNNFQTKSLGAKSVDMQGDSLTWPRN